MGMALNMYVVCTVHVPHGCRVFVVGRFPATGRFAVGLSSHGLLACRMVC